jgi:hypothetical protein
MVRRTSGVRGAAENVGLDPVQHRADEDARGHKNDDVWNAREARKTVGDKSENAKAAKN